MRNVFLTLVLANLLMLAWQFWVDPAPSGTAVLGGPDGLVGLSKGADPDSTGAPLQPGTTEAADAARLAPACGWVPWPTAAAAQQAWSSWQPGGSTPSRLRGIPRSGWATGSRSAGFASVPDAETARQRLMAGGLADAYLMQDGAQPMISLGVFRDRGRADRVAGAARSLGFEVVMRDRYRPTVEQWLLIRPRPGPDAGTRGPEPGWRPHHADRKCGLAKRPTLVATGRRAGRHQGSQSRPYNVSGRTRPVGWAGEHGPE